MSSLRRSVSSVMVILALASACGGGDGDEDLGDGDSAPAETSAAPPSTQDGGGVDGGDAAPTAGGSSITTSWSDDVTATALAVAPDGSEVAVAVAPPPIEFPTPAEVIVYDVASGGEVSRTVFEDGGLGGLPSLVWWDGGLSTFLVTLEGASLVTLDGAGGVGAPIPADDCGQFLDGEVDASGVMYTVVPGGFCRVDLGSGATARVAVEELAPTALRADHIGFDSTGALVAFVEDENFEPVAVEVDPATLAPTGGTSDETASVDQLVIEGVFGQLQEGVNTMSSDNRVAVSADGSTVALVQPGRIDVLD